MDDVGRIVLLFDFDGALMFACRNEGENRVHWQITAKTDYHGNKYFNQYGLTTHERLIDDMSRDWPDDFMWLLFHPEVFEGRIDLG